MLKRFIPIGLVVLSLFTFHFSLRAADIVCVGKATQVVSGTDTTFVFKDEIHLKCTSGPIDWYSVDGTWSALNIDEIYPGEGCYTANGHRFCCQLYKGIDDLDLSIETNCTGSILHVKGDVSSRAHTYSLSYNTLAWNTEAWADSLVTDSGKLSSTIYLQPLYDSTTVTLCYDEQIRAALDLDTACVSLTVPFDSIKAVKMQLTSLATTRGAEGEKSNEKNRPTSQDLITGSEYSGPLEVAFYSNPTPAAQFYYWAIYKSTDLIVTRNDRDIRYTFSEPGSYRVVSKVNNPICASDSMEVTVTVSESFLAVPNVFTPNGDGKNDEFRVAYRSLAQFHCWVYNRWGKLVYEWDDPAKGWDGTINGRPAAEGAYFYVIRALGTDAPKNAKYSAKAAYNKKKLNADESVIGVYQMSGDINLLRGKRN